MLFAPPQRWSWLGSFEYTVGNVICSGTPENVGPLVRGDVKLGKLAGLPDISVKVV